MSREEVARARVRILGRVQGVAFRYSTLQQAERLGVAGWVRNLDDGSVEAVFEGRPAAVERMVAWCHEGPPSARVREVRATWDEPPEGLSGFQARRTGYGL